MLDLGLPVDYDAYSLSATNRFHAETEVEENDNDPNYGIDQIDNDIYTSDHNQHLNQYQRHLTRPRDRWIRGWCGFDACCKHVIGTARHDLADKPRNEPDEVFMLLCCNSVQFSTNRFAMVLFGQISSLCSSHLQLFQITMG